MSKRVSELSSHSDTNNKKMLKTINPSTEEVIKEYELITKEQLNDTVKRSKNAFFEWKKDIDMLKRI